jgi:ribose/xylose/arabinose/galactoside ABC-type transport system permease subunit
LCTTAGAAAMFRRDRSSASSGVAVNRVVAGLALVAAACLVPIPFDRRNGQPILSWTSSAVRPVIGVAAALFGVGLVLWLRREMLRSHPNRSQLLGTAFGALYSGMLSLIGVLILLQLSTVQALRAVSMMTLSTAGIVILLLARGSARGATTRLAIGGLASAALVVLAFVVRADSSAERFRSGLFTAIVLAAVGVLGNTLVEVLFTKRSQPDPSADRWGRRLVGLGLAVAVLGLVVRVAYSNFTPEEAAKLKAAGKPVATSLLRESVIWWIVVTIVGAFVLSRMRRGNWIFAVGGNKDAARAIGVPAAQVKVSLFVTVSMLACFSGLLIALRYKTVQANQGLGEELEYIIAAVVGGCLLTGGYGSVIGASLGASIMAMSSNGISTTDWNSDARFTFLGLVLLVAVLVNTFIRKKAQEAR